MVCRARENKSFLSAPPLLPHSFLAPSRRLYQNVDLAWAKQIVYVQAVDHNNAYDWMLWRGIPLEEPTGRVKLRGFSVTGQSKKPRESESYAQAASTSRPQPNRDSESRRGTGEATRSSYSEHNLAVNLICDQVMEMGTRATQTRKPKQFASMA